MSKTLGIGIVGTGWVAGAHIANFQKIAGTHIVAVGSREQARAAAKISAHALRDCTPYDDYKKLLRHPGLDVVVLCTPHPSHPAETILAARADKHIVIEKPVALDRAALHRMCKAVLAAGVQTSVCFELRWIGLFTNIKALLAEGKLGRLFYGESAYFHGIGPWYGQYEWNRKRAMGGGAFLTAGCHALDGLIWLIGSEVESVSAMANTSKGNPLRYEYDTNVAALLQFKSGAIGKCAVSIECRQPYHFPLVLQGERGTIVDDRISTLDWPGVPKGQWARIPAAMPDSGDVDNHPYLGQLQYFVDCIRSGKRPHNDLASCAHVHEVMFAVQEAGRSGGRVKVQQVPGCKTLLG